MRIGGDGRGNTWSRHDERPVVAVVGYRKMISGVIADQGEANGLPARRIRHRQNGVAVSISAGRDRGRRRLEPGEFQHVVTGNPGDFGGKTGGLRQSEDTGAV